MDHTTTKRSAEQRKAQAEALQASIIDQVQQLADSRQWRTFLEFARSFRDYSLNNLLLILAQHSDATMVAGFRQWQAKGRQVRKGETSIKIFGYSTKTAKRTDEDNLIDEEERTVHSCPNCPEPWGLALSSSFGPLSSPPFGPGQARERWGRCGADVRQRDQFGRL